MNTAKWTKGLEGGRKAPSNAVQAALIPLVDAIHEETELMSYDQTCELLDELAFELSEHKLILEDKREWAAADLQAQEEAMANTCECEMDWTCGLHQGQATFDETRYESDPQEDRRERWMESLDAERQAWVGGAR